MRISEFSKKYGVDKRTIDYWTNCGFLHPQVNKTNGYREYGPEAEKEIKLLLIAKAMDIGSIEETFESLNYPPMCKSLFKKYVIHRLEEKKRIEMERFNDAIQYAKELPED